MPEISEVELKKQIESEAFVSLYVLHGDEKFLVRRYAERLMKKAGCIFPDFNLQKFDAAGNFDVISDAVEALPVMAERKCVVVSDLDAEACSAQELEQWMQLFSQVPETTILLVFLPTLEIDYKKASKWKKLLAAANKYGNSIQLQKRSQADVEKLLCTYATKRFCELSRQDAGYLIGLCGNDLQTLYSEMEKICAYTGSGEITRKIIDLVASPNMESTVFMLSKALIAGNYSKAYQILDQLFYQNENPVAVISVLASAYIDLYRVRCALQAGEPAQGLSSIFDYKGKEFRLRNAERDVRNLSTKVLRESLFVLHKTDVGLKSLRTDNRVQMEELIAKMLLSAEEGDRG